MERRRNLCFLLVLITIIASFAVALPVSAAEIKGDTSRLHVEKNLFYDDEPIMVTAEGKGSDWVGIVSEFENSAALYYYIDPSQPFGVGSGVAFDIRKSPYGSRSDTKILPPGRYSICLYPNNQKVSEGTPVAYADIAIMSRNAVKPKVVKNARYELANDTDGYAKGRITVETDEDQINNVDIVMYWGNENGKLPEYGPLSRFRVTEKVTVADLPDKMIIPHGATRLLVYACDKSRAEITKECFTITLPEHAASAEYTDPMFSFTVVSDIHVTPNVNHTNNKNFKRMLEAVTQLRPDSVGTFIVGDIAHNGQSIEMKNMDRIYKSVKGAAPRYMCVGNHDMRDQSSIEAKTSSFNKYVTLPDGTHPDKLHYDFWINGYHFIFLATDESGGNAMVMMKKDTIEWLDKTLAENYSPDRPAFIFLHQPLPNTLVGSLEKKYNQTWGDIDPRCEKQYRNVLAKYPEAIMFNGHTHGILSSEANIYSGDPKLPTIINTGAVGYEWDVYEEKSKGRNIKGSEGYILDVYPEKIVIKGRNFATSEWVPNAQYIVRYADDPPVVVPVDTKDSETTVPEVTTIPDETTVPAETAPSPQSDEKKVDASHIIITVCVIAVVIGGIAVAYFVTKQKSKKNHDK